MTSWLARRGCDATLPRASLTPGASLWPNGKLRQRQEALRAIDCAGGRHERAARPGHRMADDAFMDSNRRASARTALRQPATIAYADLTVSVQTIDVGRGGMCFMSRRP